MVVETGGAVKLVGDKVADSRQRMGKRRKGGGRGRRTDPEILAQLQQLLGEGERRRDLLIEYLHRIQDHYGYLSAANLVALADELKLSPVEVYETASFYHHFDLVKEGETPPAAITVRVCESISCDLAGAEALIASLNDALGEGVRIRRVPCVGRCQQAPVAVVGQNPMGGANSELVTRALKEGEVDCAIPAAIHYDDYLSQGGYQLLQACHSGEQNADDLIAELEHSGLRGLGGAGFLPGASGALFADSRGRACWRLISMRGSRAPSKIATTLNRIPTVFLRGR